MSCSPFDLKDYFLKELTEPQQRQVEAHVQDCSGCREELDRLRLTEAALCSLREEEIPQRIGFVSDPVFERSWWAAFWGSSARLGFASAAMLSVAILVLGLTHRAPAVFPSRTSYSRAEVDQRIQAAVSAAESRQERKTTQLVHELVERTDSEHNHRLIAENQAEYLQKLNYRYQQERGDYVNPSAELGGPR
jgi:anti-sigma factor RsiW